MCCLGPSLAGNPTQYVIEKCFQQAGWDRRFLSLQVAAEDLSIAVDGMRAMDFCGAVITAPFQSTILDCLENVSADAKRVGGVNCLHRDSDRNWLGENTVGTGFLHSLKKVFDPKDRKVLLLHTGLTARAIALALAEESVAEIAVAGGDADAGSDLVSLLESASEVPVQFVPWEGDISAAQDVHLVIHAPEPGEVEPSEEVALVLETLGPEMLLVDMCLGSPTTAFLRAGVTCGCQVLHGQQMLVAQWAECVRLWTGSEPDSDVMREALEEYLGL